ncbi:hypothetical protein [Absidia glauca]|uniref:peptidylprolyl isomerase n=1 Tax=Absidia glauca TaxID=4829 RepID=A0A163J1L0_ABSGL|nr:hypothetical protein [Absidia glauca]
MEPGLVHSSEVIRPFMITMATLPETLLNNKRSTLSIKIDNVKYALCSLIPDKTWTTEQQLMNLTFQAGEWVTFYVKGDKDDGTNTSEWNERIDQFSETNDHWLSTSSHGAHGFEGEDMEDSSDDESVRPTQRQLMKRRSESTLPYSTKKRKEHDIVPPSPIPYDENSGIQVQRLLDQMAKSTMDLPTIPTLPRQRHSLPTEGRTYHFQPDHSFLDPLDHHPLSKRHRYVESTPHHEGRYSETYQLDRRSSHSSQQRKHSRDLLDPHLPESSRKQQQQRKTSETTTQKEATNKKRVRNDRTKKSPEERLLEAKLKQDKRLEARQQQEEKKKDKRLEHRKQRKERESKKKDDMQESLSTLSIDLLDIASPGPSSQQRQEPLPDGFEIEDKRVGTGRPASFGDTVGVRFISKMENGKVFDQNILGDLYKLTIGCDDVPSGWNFSVQGMQLNGEREVTVPPPYAKDLHPDIPRTEAITMNVKLLELEEGVQ